MMFQVSIEAMPLQLRHDFEAEDEDDDDEEDNDIDDKEDAVVLLLAVDFGRLALFPNRDVVRLKPRTTRS